MDTKIESINLSTFIKIMHICCSPKEWLGKKKKFVWRDPIGPYSFVFPVEIYSWLGQLCLPIAYP